MLALAGILLILAALGLAYAAGADTRDRDDWDAEQAPSRRRHPAGRDA